MGFRNTNENYGSIAKFFHWLIFALIVTLLLVSWFMGKLSPELKGTVYNTHKLVGLTVLLLTTARLIWAVSGSKPKLPSAMKPWEKLAEKAVHIGLYACLIFMPLCGWIMSTAAGQAPQLLGYTVNLPGVIQDKATSHLFNNYHAFIAWVIVALVSVHVGAALKHHFINRDNVLRTMLPSK